MKEFLEDGDIWYDESNYKVRLTSNGRLKNDMDAAQWCFKNVGMDDSWRIEWQNGTLMLLFRFEKDYAFYLLGHQ